MLSASEGPGLLMFLRLRASIAMAKSMGILGGHVRHSGQLARVWSECFDPNRRGPVLVAIAWPAL